MRSVAREVSLDDGDSRRDLAARLATDTPSPSDRAIQAEEAQALERALQQLPDEYRQAITLRNREGCSFDVIGDRMGRSAEAARKLWARAVRQLREKLGPEL